MKRKLAIVDQAFNWPPKGGSSVDTKEIAERLTRHGMDVRVFTPEIMRKGKARTYWSSRLHQLNQEELNFQVEKIRIPLVKYQPGYYSALLKERIESFNPDDLIIGDSYFMKPHLVEALRNYEPILRFYTYEILCFNYNQGLPRRDVPQRCDTYSLDNWRGCHLCFWRDLKWHDRDLFRLEYLTSGAWKPGYRKRFTDALGAAKTIIVNNQLTRQMMAPYARDIRLIPHGVDTSFFVPVSASVTGSSNTVTVSESNSGPTVLIMTGRVNDPAKGGSILIDACRKLHDNDEKIKLLLTGDQCLDDSFIEWVGWLSHDRIPGLLNRADIAVAPAVWQESLGIAVLEAMACELPVVVSDVAGHRVTVRANETGLFFKAGDSSDLAGKLKQLIDSEDRRKRLGTAGRLRAEEYFDWDRIIEKHYLGELFQ